MRAAEWRTRDRGRRLSQGGMGIRAGVPPGAVRLESSRYGPGCDFSCAVSDPEPSPRPIVRSGGGRLRGFCETRPGSIEASRHLRRCSDRGATSSVGVQRGAPTGSGPLGLRLGLCALRLARSRSFRSPDVRQKVADLQDIPAMARPGLEPGTPRFSVVWSCVRVWPICRCFRQSRGVGRRPRFPALCGRLPCEKARGGVRGPFRRAGATCSRTLSVPTTSRDVRKAVAARRRRHHAGRRVWRANRFDEQFGPGPCTLQSAA